MNAVLKQQQPTPQPDPKIKARAVAKAVAQAHENKELTDAGNAARFASKFENVLAFVPARGQWMEYIGHAWHADTLGRVTQRAIEATRDVMGEAAKLAIEAMQSGDPTWQAVLASRAETLLQHARKSQQKPRLDAMVSIASTDPRLAVDQARLDADDMLLGVENGVLELGDTTVFRDGRPEDLITRQAGAPWRGGDADVGCPLWERFLEQIQPDPDVRAWLQRFVGYCLTGSTQEQIFLVMHGGGDNGKGVLIETIKKMLGTHAQTTQFATFTERDPNAIRNDLAAMDKVRLVVASEGQEGARLDEGVVKQITGQDPVSARFLHREFFTYQPRFKIILVSNHRPIIKGTDRGIWRRVVLMPFDVIVPEDQKDKRLAEKLVAEMPGILAWAVAGFHAWREQGLGDLPLAMREATAQYRKESDTLGMWIEDRCTVDCSRAGAEMFSSSTELSQSFSQWAEMNGHRAISSKTIGDRLRERGLTPGKRRGERGWVGIRVNPN